MSKPLRAVLQAFIALCVIAVFSALAVIASEPLKKVPPGMNWRIAVGMGDGWDREQFIAPILNGKPLEGMSHSAVLRLFGNPGYSAINYPGTDRFDVYRLSAKNNRVFRINYDRSGKAESDWIEDGACDCPTCKTDSPEVPIETIRHAGLLENRDFIDGSLTIGKLEKQLGQPGSWDAGNSSAGGQVWFNFSDTWRISSPSQAQPGQYFIADGHTPFRDLEIGKEKELSVGSWAIVTYISGCMTK